MIKWRRENFKGKTYHKFVLNPFLWDDFRAFYHCKARATEFCKNEIDPDKWSMFKGGFRSYTIYLIEDDDDATLFKLSFIMHGEEYKGKVSYEEQVPHKQVSRKRVV